MSKNKTSYKFYKNIIASLVVIMLLASVSSINVSASEDSTENTKIIVSLGDSYSSGEGIEDFYDQDLPLFEKVKSSDWISHRSENSWPGMLSLPSLEGTMSEYKDKNWYFVAASGAKTVHINEPFFKNYDKITFDGTLLKGTVPLLPQASIFDDLKKEGKYADYVTVTIGGNDVDFEETVIAAFKSSIFLNPSYITDKINNTWRNFYKGGIRENIKKTYENIHLKAGKQAKILVVGYPQLVNSSGSKFFSREVAQSLNRAVSQFNKKIELIVKNYQSTHEAKIYFVSVEEAFQGHEAYTKDSYINGIMLSQSEDISDLGLPISSYSMHPNKKGARIYAECVQAEIDKLEGGNSQYNTNIDLTVYDINSNLYNDYTVDIKGSYNTGLFGWSWFGLFEKEYNDHFVVDSSEAQSIILNDNGNYKITVTDNRDPAKSYSKDIKVSKVHTSKSMPFSTDFGATLETNVNDKSDETETAPDASYSTNYDKNTMKYRRMVAKDEKYTFMKDLNGKLERKNNDGTAGDEILYDKGFFTICGIDASYLYLLKGSENDGVYDIVRISKDGKKIDTLLQEINWCLYMDDNYFYYVPSDNNKSIRRLDRAKITSDHYCEFNEPVEVLIPQDNNFMVVTKEDSIFALFGGNTNNFYLIDKSGEIIKEYGGEIAVEEYPREKNDEGGYNTAIKYVSNGYLRPIAAEAYLEYGGSFIEAKGISGWNPTKNGIVTTLNNDSAGENALPYKIVLYDATSGVSKKMTDVQSDQAFFTMCQDDNGDWCYIDEVEGKLILYSLSSDFSSKEIITEIDAGKLNCSLETCSMEIMDNRIYFYSMPDNKTANAIYRYDLILED